MKEDFEQDVWEMLKDLGCRFKLGWSQKLLALRVGGGRRLWSENLRAVGQDFSLCILCQTNLEQPWWFDKFLIALVPRHQPFPWQFHTEYWAVHAFDTAADHCHLGHTVAWTFAGSLGIWGTWRTLANGGTLELFGRDPDPHDAATYVSWG